MDSISFLNLGPPSKPSQYPGLFLRPSLSASCLSLTLLISFVVYIILHGRLRESPEYGQKSNLSDSCLYSVLAWKSFFLPKRVVQRFVNFWREPARRSLWWTGCNVLVLLHLCFCCVFLILLQFVQSFILCNHLGFRTRETSPDFNSTLGKKNFFFCIPS